MKCECTNDLWYKSTGEVMEFKKANSKESTAFFGGRRGMLIWIIIALVLIGYASLLYVLRNLGAGH
jgi:uncharacterized membrane protein YczE